MSSDEARLRRNGSSVIQTMLKRLAEEEKQLLEPKTVGTVPVETAKPLAKAALY
jgi:hypothetical protein